VRELGIEFISVFGLPPVEFVRLAAELGVRNIGMALEPMPGFNPQDYPAWSLRADRALRRDMAAAMADTGVRISLGEGLVVFPDKDMSDYAHDLEAMAELGVTRLNTLSFDPDIPRSIEQFAKLADMAAPAGMEVMLEFTPSKKIADFSMALDAQRQVGRDNVKVLVDTMHFARSGSSLDALAAADPARIGYVQLCDSTRDGEGFAGYTDEAIYERQSPGRGELPLREILAALPRDLIYSLEVPLRRQAEAGVGPHERLRAALDDARRLLEAVDG
jgi:sugar phosphate isomerase/epimerase